MFVGPEALISQGLAASAIGAVSALASAFPERVAAAVRDPAAAEAWGRVVRAAMERFPFQAALKHVARAQGVPIRRTCAAAAARSDDEREELDRRWLESS